MTTVWKCTRCGQESYDGETHFCMLLPINHPQDVKPSEADVSDEAEADSFIDYHNKQENILGWSATTKNIAKIAFKSGAKHGRAAERDKPQPWKASYLDVREKLTKAEARIKVLEEALKEECYCTDASTAPSTCDPCEALRGKE